MSISPVQLQNDHITLNRARGPSTVMRWEVSMKIFDADYVLIPVHSAGYVHTTLFTCLDLSPCVQDPLVPDHN